MKPPNHTETGTEDHRDVESRIERESASISIDVVRRSLEPWLRGRRVLDVSLLAGGLVNRNLRLRLDAEPCTCVLRLYDREPAACAKEQAVLDLVRSDAPVPDVLYANHEASEDLPPFLVLEYVDGVSLRTLRGMNEIEGVAAASFEAGECLARFSRHRFPRIGPLDAKLSLVEGGWLGDMPVTNTTLAEHFMRAPAFGGRVDAPLRERVLRFAVEADVRFAELPAQAVLVHGDYNARNLFARRDGDRWRLAAVLDWEFAFAGSVFNDLGNFVRYERPGRPRHEPAFSEGCRAGGLELPSDWMRVARAADLPALLELLGRSSTSSDVVRELIDLVANTVA